MSYVQSVGHHSRVECFRCGHWACMIEELHKEEFPGARDQITTHKCGNCGYRGQLAIYEGTPTLVHPMQP